MSLYTTAYLYHPDSSFSPDIDQIDLFDLALGKTLQQHLKNSLHQSYHVTKILNINLYPLVVYLTSSCVNWAFFGMSGPI
jgi:hypothetical protein